MSDREAPAGGDSGAGRGGGDRALAELALRAGEYRDDRRVLRISLAVAVVFHVVLFAIDFPEMARQARAEPPRAQRIFVVQQPRFKAPEVRAAQRAVLKPNLRRVPIPDPTPDEPEPVREVEPEEVVLELAVPDESVFGVPDGPPIPGEPGAPIPVGQIREPRRLLEVKPVYPEAARKARLEGVVILEIIVNKTGDVRAVKILRPLEMGLTEAAVEAVKQWKYEPSTLDGRPVEVLITVTVRFSLQ